MLNISNEEYRKMEGVSSSVLKKLLVSDAHLDYVLKHGWQRTESTILGDAIHAFFLEKERFESMYKKEIEVYKRATGDKVAGDPKLDENGEPIVILRCESDSSLDIKGEQYKKFVAMTDSLSQCKEAMDIYNNKFNVEMSFFDKYNDITVKARCDCMYKDAEGKVWIVDLKTVGGMKDKPSSAEKFSYTMYDMGYDLQAYMYTEIIKKEIPDVYGFKFLCIDAKCPSGVKIYNIIPGESDWYELGGYRFQKAMEKYINFKKTDLHTTYQKVEENDLPISFSAADELSLFREGAL